MKPREMTLFGVQVSIVRVVYRECISFKRTVLTQHQNLVDEVSPLQFPGQDRVVALVGWSRVIGKLEV